MCLFCLIFLPIWVHISGVTCHSFSILHIDEMLFDSDKNIWPCANSWRFTIKRHWLIDCRWAYPLFHRRCESTKGWSLRKSQTPQFTKTPTWSWAGHGDMTLPPRPHHQSSTYTTTLKQLSTSLQQPSSHLSTTSHSTQQKLSSVPL